MDINDIIEEEFDETPDNDDYYLSLFRNPLNVFSNDKIVELSLGQGDVNFELLTEEILKVIKVLKQEEQEEEQEKEQENKENDLPKPPQFNIFKHLNPLHKAHLNLPSTMQELSYCDPYSIFSLFFSIEILNIIVENTNEYAKSKFAEKKRSWDDLTLSELKIFLAIIIYMGLFKMPSMKDYWNNKQQFPIHNITRYMTCLHFEQIKRFLHISSINSQLQSNVSASLFPKLEPLASYIQNASKKYYIPSSNVSVDEMIARFLGRSYHTFRIKNKPNPKGFKILSLCDAGYTYAFIFLSRKFDNPEVQSIPNLNKTSCEVYHLVKQLPPKKSFNIYMDNFFSNINLFSFLRSKNFDACGTARVNSSKYPKILKINNKLDWDTLSGVVADDVLAVLWIDNGPVTMLSTLHEINNGLKNRINRERRYPRINKTNSSTIKKVFSDQPKKILPIPKIIDDYNHYMGGVDIADQLRSNYIIQFPVRRTCLIKTALEPQPTKETRGSKGKQKTLTKKQSYVTKNFNLPPERLIEAKHLIQQKTSIM
ncbi:piggyBac transposable element-derived protein 4-like isoform X1 [Rhizophagus clarus]|uniref:PiggyBac transposable element-derived protein 4-like isoform X1 n=1 Tax=Rhizophagus clarus TaxID=94130 RepID=A0A8H3MD07_9GLOM|nr:piggyBac transposable element-derived protein 4-like isoform X1 [Rhizophagus clarus]